MFWVIATVAAIALGGTGFLLLRGKKQVKGLGPKRVIARLTKLSPMSATISLSRRQQKRDTASDLGKVFFLRREKKIYRERNFIYPELFIKKYIDRYNRLIII